jgi:hypothetical protein
VTFCHVIANPHTTPDNVQLLSDYVAMLRSLSHLSEGIARFYSLCSVFERVASLYVRAKAQETVQPETSGLAALSDMTATTTAIHKELRKKQFGTPTAKDKISAKDKAGNLVKDIWVKNDKPLLV